MASTKVTISKLGRVRLQPQGYEGTDCKDATRAVENAFRGAEANVTELPEMHQMSTGENEQELEHEEL